LNKGGRIVNQEFYIKRERTHPFQSALFSVNMLVNTKSGRCYSPEEIINWLSRIKLENIQERLIEDTVLITGQRN